MAKSRIVLLSVLSLALFAPFVDAEETRPEVILIRGGAGYWPGVTALANDLREHGFAPMTIIGALYSLTVSDIAETYYAGRRCAPVTIVGYSSGADYACHLCRGLQKRGVPVATLVLMESTLGTSVPENVELCVNIYESRPHTDWIPAFRGIPVEAIGPRTEVMNLDVSEQPQLNWLTSYNHFTIASGSETRVMLRNLLLARQSQSLRVSSNCVGLQHRTSRAQVRTAPPAATQPQHATVQPITVQPQRPTMPGAKLSTDRRIVPITDSRTR